MEKVQPQTENEDEERRLQEELVKAAEAKEQAALEEVKKKDKLWFFKKKVAPGPSSLGKEDISLTICGPAYFFRGPAHSFWYVISSLFILDTLLS
jgi:hypothetical protein